MKYVLLIFQPVDFDAKSLSENDYKAVAAGYEAVNKTPNVKPGLPLGIPEEAVTVQFRNGQPSARDGTYLQHPGTAIGGYCEFEAESMDDAIRLAGRIPAVALGGAVEIRPAKIYW
jgi:hypothetical protein